MNKVNIYTVSFINSSCYMFLSMYTFIILTYNPFICIAYVHLTIFYRYICPIVLLNCCKQLRPYSSLQCIALVTVVVLDELRSYVQRYADTVSDPVCLSVYAVPGACIKSIVFTVGMI